MAKIIADRDSDIKVNKVKISLQSDYNYSGSRVIYNWVVKVGNKKVADSNKEEPTITITDLQGGKYYLISCDLQVEVINYNTDPITGITSESVSKYSEDGYLDVYTHPGKFSWESKGIKPGATISTTLKASDVDEWLDHIAAYDSWVEQEDCYNDYDDEYDPKSGKGYRVYKGDLIYLKWFNNCADAHPRGVKAKETDSISAELFYNLDFAGPTN